MQFTKAEEYGIFGVLYLAEQSDNRVTPLSEIAEIQDVPEKFLAKIFQSLSRSGLVVSHRGVKGGFALAKDPAEITMKDIVEAIQGPYFIAKCLHDEDVCDKENCVIQILLGKAQDALIDVFESHTVVDLLEWQKEPVTS